MFGFFQKRTSKQLKRQVEHKYFDKEEVGQAVGSAGVLLRLNLVPRGVMVTERIGDVIHMSSVSINLTMVSALAFNINVCIVVFYSKDSTIAVPGDWFSNIGTNLAPLSVRNYQKRFDAKTLFWKNFILDSTDALKQISIKIKLKGAHSMSAFPSGEVTPSFVEHGRLTLAIISSNSVAANMLVDYKCRTFFTDS